MLLVLSVRCSGTKFKQSMAELVENLMRKEPHYVRCVKPNDVKAPNKFDRDRVEHQVRCGVVVVM